MKFKNKTVIVTGGSNGIGQAVAKMYAEEGARVVIADVDEKGGTETAENISKKGGQALFVKTDFRSPADINGLMVTTEAEFGKIDIVINNAGLSKFKPFFEQTVEEWDDILSVNLRGYYLTAREAAALMKKADGGSIINIASTRAIMSEPGSEAYAASKAGIIGLTHALAASLSEFHIHVNAISPGWIETGDYDQLRAVDHHQHFSKRVGTPEDIARACLFLSDPANNFVNGANLVVDGGMTRKMIYEH